jgi:DNA-binding NarL/FixJ family response regulator
MAEDVGVLIVEDHDYLRDGLATYLNECEGLRVVGTAANGKEAVARCAEFNPDVVLMDIRMPESNGIEATRTIRQQYPHIQVVILTNSIEDDEIDAALAAGARTYLT